MNDFNLIEISKIFRAAIESIRIENRPPEFKEFPAGACGDATLLLGTYFSDCGILGFEYVSGERGVKAENTWHTHAWLQKENCIIDITADQFPEVTESVIVCENSSWHKTFTAESMDCSDFRELNGNMGYLYSLYEEILLYISTKKYALRDRPRFTGN